MLFKKIYRTFLSQESKKKVEQLILRLALFSFLVHLILIYLVDFGWIELFPESDLFRNPISAIYTPFSFILIYEVYLLIYYLPRSFTTYVTKQYEIITLIIIRKLFKDLSSLELTTDWFAVKGDMQFTYDIVASLVLFYLIFQVQKQGQRLLNPVDYQEEEKIQKFIKRKKIIATGLVPIFFSLAFITLINWLGQVSFSDVQLPSFKQINNLFFDDFFTILILVDVVLLLVSFFYTDQFHKIIRNSGFVVSTILIRLSFGASGLIATILIVGAVLFGLLMIMIHNQYQKSLPDKQSVKDDF